MRISQARFIKSSPSYRDDPAIDKVAFAMIGRSNVGKSSLINRLVNQKKLAKTSSTPGKTGMINYFLVNETFYLVDLPGYGYARVSKRTKASWEVMIREYLLHSTSLAHLFVLVDGRLAPQPIDLAFINWLGKKKIFCSILFTKVDGVGKSLLQRNVLAFKARLRETWGALPPCFITSAKRGEGKEAILAYMEGILQSYTKPA